MSQIVFYKSDAGTFEVRLGQDTVWLTQKQLAELLDTSTDNIGLHLKNIFLDQELIENSTIEEISVVREFIQRQRENRQYDEFLRCKVEGGRASMHAGLGQSNDEVETKFVARHIVAKQK